MPLQVKITKSGPRRYLQVIESFWDSEKKRSRQRFVASLGRLEEVSDSGVQTLVNGLLRATGQPTLTDLEEGIDSESTSFEPAVSVGATWLLTKLWKELGLDRILQQAVSRRRFEIPVERLVRTMVFNRLCDPESKLGVLRWLEGVHLPEVEKSDVTHQRLLRAMDAVIESKDRIEEKLASHLFPLFDRSLDVVFYDLTTVGVSGESELDDDVRQYGRSKGPKAVERQFAVGVVQTADGFPVMHEVHPGNISETTTVESVVKRLTDRFEVRRLVFVADRGMLSQANLRALEETKLGSGRSAEYIVAVPARRDRAMTDQALALHEELNTESRKTKAQSVREVEVDGRRVIIAHNPEAAKATRHRRARRIVRILRRARQLQNRLEAYESGDRGRGRPPSDGRAKVELQQLIRERKLTRILTIDHDLTTLNWDWNVDELKRELRLDGKLIIVTNVAKEDLSATDLISRYKDLADIERGFRVMKSELEIGPVYHRLEDRIRAHTLICFLALVLHRVIRHKLRIKDCNISPERLLYKLRSIQRHSVTLGTGKKLDGVSRLEPEQKLLFEALEMAPPTRSRLR